MNGERPVRAQVDLGAVRENAARARRCAEGRELIGVVKADAYGHGAVAVGRALLGAGCERLAVLSVAEAAELRESAIAAPILVLGGLHGGSEAERAAALHLTPVVHDEAGAEYAAAAARTAGSRMRVHVEVDTGMHRMGAPAGEAAALMSRITQDPALELEGAMTHLASSDDPDPASALAQLAHFRTVLAAARKAGCAPRAIHVSNSGGVLAGKPVLEALPEATAVRPGLMLYGAHPGSGVGSDAGLRPAMTLRAGVVRIHELAAGDGVGYGGTFRAEGPTRVATLAAGYADGVPWSLANRGEVWLSGAKRRLVGRVSMDTVGVLIGDAPVRVGDEAVIFGGHAEACIPVEEVARCAGTLAYELLVRIGNRVRREYVDGV